MVIFDTDSLLIKWGFRDGDMLDNLIYEVSAEINIPDEDVDFHQCLYGVLEKHVLPKIKNRLEVQFIETNHNPVRTRSLDGVEVDWFDLNWYENSGLKLDPEVVSVEEGDVKQTIMEVLATEQTLAADHNDAGQN